MSSSMLVRASRDGDQFHYLWAARRVLALLNPKAELVAVSIEGASSAEQKTGDPIEAGEELIDIGEYYGSADLEKATLVRYMQLKHSTLHANEAWPPSGLEKTIKGFSKRYLELRGKYPDDVLQGKVEFWFVTNRPISTNFVESVSDAAASHEPRHPVDFAKLKEFTALDGDDLAKFCQTLRFEGGQDNYWAQRNILAQDVSGYLPASDVDAPTRLKELVTQKALSESAANADITRLDVLRALNVEEAALYPAPCLIQDIPDAIPREQETTFSDDIISASGKPVIVSADAGVGKSVFSTKIGGHLPKGSVSILYDCFGNGQYRSTSGYRHRHRTALVQIANELSSRGLCHPLIPYANADASEYMRAFLHRLAQSIAILKAANPDALLCVIVDAADNAQMAAHDISEPNSFVRDLLRENLPDGVRLVALCRPYRVDLLNPPPEVVRLELQPFTRSETEAHLRGKFPKATDHDVDEFHRLSSHNPRVQAFALSRDVPLNETLRLLGPNPKTVESTIGEMLDQSIAVLRDKAGKVEGSQIHLICTGLAALRPLIPISVLASMSGVDQAAIRSFVLDLKRPLILNTDTNSGDTIQFFDEPAESWFRDKFKPDSANIKTFVERLKPLASNSAYVAAALPQLMLEAGQFSELVALALSSSGLPEVSQIERRDIELQRLQFALKASIRSQQYGDAVKLSLKAGGVSAGHDRQTRLLQDNTDLAALFMDTSALQELVSRSAFGSSWTGGHHAYEAALLSEHKEFLGDARSRLRMAEDWLRNWSKLPDAEREKERVSDEDRAIMAMAHFNIHGAKAAAQSLRVWRPRVLSYGAGRILASRFLDRGRYQDLDALAIAAENDLGLILGIAIEARKRYRLLPIDVAKRGLKLLLNIRGKLEEPRASDEVTIASVCAMVEILYKAGACDTSTAVALLERYLPETPPYDVASHFSGSRAQYLRAYALHSALLGKPLQLEDVARPELKKELEDGKRHSDSQELREFKENLGQLLPWYNLWGQAFLGKIPQPELDAAVSIALAATAKSAASVSRDGTYIANEIAPLWMDVLIEAGGVDQSSVQKIIDWGNSSKRFLFTPRLNHLANLCTQIDGAKEVAFKVVQLALSQTQNERSDAQVQAECYIGIARAILPLSQPEAKAYFGLAIEVASKIGDENVSRWDALIDLANRAGNTNRPAPEVAYKLSRCAEVVRAYIDREKHFPWSATAEAMAKLCPSSSLAIISRWRDRDFGRNGQVLSETIESLVESGMLHPMDALPLIGFRTEWSIGRLVERAYAACDGSADGTTALRMAYRFMELEPPSADAWHKLKKIADDTDIAFPGLESHIEEAEQESARERAKWSSYEKKGDLSEQKEYWDSFFVDFDLTTPSGIADAYHRYRSGEPPFYMERFFRAAVLSVPIGAESDFVTAFSEVSEFDLYSLRQLLEAIPQDWKTRLSSKGAIASALKRFCQRFCMDLRLSRYYDVIPFDLAFELSGLNKVDLIDVVLKEIGETEELAGASQFFSLVGLLSHKLTSDIALDVLSYGLDLFEHSLEEGDGDGPWSDKLLPPSSVEESLAGYIWAQLASPVTAVRWEAAHVVVGLCALKRDRVLSGLFKHAEANTTAPFGDSRFAFYSLHAQLWLLIASSRAVLEYGNTLVPYVDYFLARSSADEAHVLIRKFAARTMLELCKQGLVSLPQASLDALSNINKSAFALVKADDSTKRSSRWDRHEGSDSIPEQYRYFFGIDFGPYWLKPLGRCFGLSKARVEEVAVDVIRRRLDKTASSRKDDERAKLGIYRYPDTSHSHGSYPRVEDYVFYLSYHAMLIAAGELLSTDPLVEDSYDEGRDPFEEWLNRHDISRVDKRWLSDRRDPKPHIHLAAPEELQSPDWWRSISADEFERALYSAPGEINVWGEWSEPVSNVSFTQTTSVSTALVAGDRSDALLRALQTTKDPFNFRIPPFDDDLQIEAGPYRLKGWITEHYFDQGIDTADPWAGGVRFPAPQPANYVVELMQLSCDADRRIWVAQPTTTPVLTSEVWGYFSERDGYEQPSGRRLNASIPFLLEFLRKSAMDMVVEIDIRKRPRYQSYRNRDDELADLPQSTRIYIIKGDGTIRAF